MCGRNDYYATYGIKAKDLPIAHDDQLMVDLWNLSEQLTETSFDGLKDAIKDPQLPPSETGANPNQPSSEGST